jgi:hypothetical protein
MRGELGKFLSCHAVVQCEPQVGSELIGAAQRGQRRDRDQAAVAARQLLAGPYVSEQHLIGQLGELRGDAAHQLLRSTLLLCHAIPPVIHGHQMTVSSRDGPE